MVRYICRKCGSDRIQGTRPAWFDVNTFAPGVGSLGTASDDRSEWGDGRCEGCGASGPYSEVVQRADSMQEASFGGLTFVSNPDVPSDMVQAVFPDRIESFRIEDGHVVEHHIAKRPDASE